MFGSIGNFVKEGLGYGMVERALESSELGAQLGFGKTQGEKDALAKLSQAEQTALDHQKFTQDFMNSYALSASGDLINNALNYTASLTTESIIAQDMVGFRQAAIDSDKRRKQIMASTGLAGSGVDVSLQLQQVNQDFSNRAMSYSTAGSRLASQQMGMGMQLEQRRGMAYQGIVGANQGLQNAYSNTAQMENTISEQQSKRFASTLELGATVAGTALGGGGGGMLGSMTGLMGGGNGQQEQAQPLTGATTNFAPLTFSSSPNIVSNSQFNPIPFGSPNPYYSDPGYANGWGR